MSPPVEIDPRWPEPIRKRWLIAEESALARAKAIQDRIGPIRRAEFARRLQEIEQSRLHDFTRLRALYALADEHFALVGDNVACRRGCSHCCHCAVAITKTEAQMLGTAIKRRPVNAPRREGRDEFGNFVGFDWGYHNPCAFLKNGECSIYEHRPLTCRVHFNLDVDDVLCHLNPPIGQTVPWLDASSYRTASIRIGGNHIADIRDFFPRQADPR